MRIKCHDYVTKWCCQILSVFEYIYMVEYESCCVLNVIVDYKSDAYMWMEMLKIRKIINDYSQIYESFCFVLDEFSSNNSIICYEKLLQLSFFNSLNSENEKLLQNSFEKIEH